MGMESSSYVKHAKGLATVSVSVSANHVSRQRPWLVTSHDMLSISVGLTCTKECVEGQRFVVIDDDEDHDDEEGDDDENDDDDLLSYTEFHCQCGNL